MSKVLVATTAERGVALVNLFSAMGVSAEAVPVMSYMGPENPEEIKIQVENIDCKDHVIFVSPQSVKSFKSFVKNLKTRNIYAVGPGTAEFIKNNFNKTDHEITYPKEPGLINSAGLWDLIKNKVWKDQKVFIIRGGEGNNFLAEKLVEQGADLIFLDLYRRQCALENRQLLWAAVLAGDDLKLVVLTSLEMIQCFFDLLEKKTLPEDLVFTSPSEAANTYLRSKGIREIILLNSMNNFLIADQVKIFLEEINSEKWEVGNRE